MLGMQVSSFVISPEPNLIIPQVRCFAVDVVSPRVRDTDEKEAMAPEIVKGLFDQGARVKHSTYEIILNLVSSLWVLK